MKKYIKNTILVCFAMVLGAIIFDVLPYSSSKYGTLADWVSGLATFGAFIVVFWQMKKEEGIQRAMGIENCRPRFALSLLSNKDIPSKDTILLGKNNNINTFNSHANQKNFGSFFLLKNISSNNIYSITIQIRYFKKTLNFKNKLATKLK